MIEIQDENESQEELVASINHSIPHRFVETFHLSASWCSHCGSMVPIGKKNSLRCSDCNIASHKECQHLIPNYCGLNPQRINMMLRAIEEIQNAKHIRDTIRSNVETFLPLRVSIDNGVLARELISQEDHTASIVKANDSLKLSRHVKGVTLDDFNLVAVLGKGNFGKVMLAKEKNSQLHFAIKILKKDFIIENDEVESTRSEKRVFLTANEKRFPFLVNLHSCFQTESRLYFVMEYDETIFIFILIHL